MQLINFEHINKRDKLKKNTLIYFDCMSSLLFKV